MVISTTSLTWAGPWKTVPADVYLNYSLLEVYKLLPRTSDLFAHQIFPLHIRRFKLISISPITCSYTQVEIDYKSECMAGQTVESLGSHIEEGHQRNRHPKVCLSRTLALPESRLAYVDCHALV